MTISGVGWKTWCVVMSDDETDMAGNQNEKRETGNNRYAGLNKKHLPSKRLE